MQHFAQQISGLRDAWIRALGDDLKLGCKPDVVTDDHATAYGAWRLNLLECIARATEILARAARVPLAQKPQPVPDGIEITAADLVSGCRRTDGKIL